MPPMWNPLKANSNVDNLTLHIKLILINEPILKNIIKHGFRQIKIFYRMSAIVS